MTKYFLAIEINDKIGNSYWNCPEDVFTEHVVNDPTLRVCDIGHHKFFFNVFGVIIGYIDDNIPNIYIDTIPFM